MAGNGRNPVAQGGMWSTPKVNYSKETQNLLKGMIFSFVTRMIRIVYLHKALHNSQV